MINLDNLDTKIIEALQENGRIASTKLASKFSVNEGTIRKRIKKLINSGILSIKGLINPSLIDNKHVIMVGIRVSISKDLVAVAKEIANIPLVYSVVIVTGRYDIFIELFLEPSKYADFLANELSEIKSITSTESFIGVNCVEKWIQ